MPQHVVIRGRVVTSVEECIDVYIPRASAIPRADWAAIRPLVTKAVAAAGFESVHTAPLSLRVVSRFVHWTRRFGNAIDAEARVHARPGRPVRRGTGGR